MRPQVSSLIKVFILVLVVLIPVEVFSYFVAQILVERGALFAPPKVVDYAEYLAIRDPLLGWPSPESIGTGEFDSSGSRIVPSFPDPATPPCVELFGDSFTWGDEVSPEQAWGNILAARMNCRVANYGVSGYGPDQAFLRFRDRIETRAPVVVLGYWSENIVRTVNRYRGFLAPGADVGFKPRFVVRGSNLDLTLIPMPSPGDDGFSILNVSDDWFAPGAGGGVGVARFPFTWAVARSLGHFKIRAALRREPSYAQLYEQDSDSGGLQTVLAIMRAFSAEAARRNQQGLVLLVPSDFDLESLRSNGVTYYQPLTLALEANGIEAFDTASLFLAELGARPACELYIRCGGHLTPEGNEWLARFVGDHLSVESSAATSPSRAE